MPFSLRVLVPAILLAAVACVPTSPTAVAPAATAPGAGSPPPSEVRRPPQGPHAVGFRTVEAVDPSRGFGAPFDDEGAERPVLAERPVALSIWYPAVGRGTPLRVRDYLGYFTNAGEFPGTAEQRARTAIRVIGDEPLPPHGARELEAAAYATLDAPAAAGPFPLVVYAPGLGASAVDNFHLHEWLASRGYVVVGVDSWGPEGRPTPGAAGLEAQTRDMEFALGWARGLATVDASRVAFVGFSWGGMANVMAAVRNPAIHAVVSLDGSINFFAEQMKDFPSFAPDRLTVPSLFLSSRQLAPAERRARGYDFFDRLHYSEATKVVFPRLSHMNFTSVSPLLDGPNPRYETDPEVVGPSLDWIARYTAAFLDAVLHDDPEGRAFLARAPAENGIPAGEALVERRAAQRPLPTRAAFAGEVRRRGMTLADAPAVLEAIRAANPRWSLGEDEVNDWGYSLLRSGRQADAIGVFEVNVRLHPDAPNPHDSLGDGYAAAGRLEEALASYRRAATLAEASGDARAENFRANAERIEARLSEGR